jgi:hypothetical protein
MTGSGSTAERHRAGACPDQAYREQSLDSERFPVTTQAKNSIELGAIKSDRSFKMPTTTTNPEIPVPYPTVSWARNSWDRGAE